MHHTDCVDILAEIAEGLAFLTPVDSHVGVDAPDGHPVAMAVAIRYSERNPSSAPAISGQLALGLGDGLPRALAVNMLGCPPRSAIADDTIRDAALELVNVLTGNVLPRIYGTVREFALSSPFQIVAMPSSGIQACSLTTEEGLLSMIMTEQP